MSERYKIAIVAVVDGDGNLLMIRRVNDHNDSNAAKWEFPAGHIDGGELPEVAAVREVFEETGLEVYLMPWSIDLPTKAGKAAQFLGFVANGDIKPEPDLAEDEHDRHIWVKAQDLSKVKPTHKNMGENLSKLLKRAKVGLNGEPSERNASRREAAETGRSFSIYEPSHLYDFTAKDGNKYGVFWRGRKSLAGQKGLGFRVEIEDSSGQVVSYLQLKPLDFSNPNRRPKYWEPFQVLTEHEFKRKGLAGELYRATEKVLGFPPRKSKESTEEGRLFRNYYHKTKGREAAKTGQPFSGTLYRGIEPDPAKARRDRIPSQFAVGAYWTDNPEIAETYGREVISRDITLNNPYVLTLGEKAYFQELKKEFGTLRPDEITKKLLREGYDGLIVKNVPIQRRKPDGEYVVMRDSTEYILFNRRHSNRRQANQLLPTRMVKPIPEPTDDLREAILVGDEVEIFLKDQVSRGDDPSPDVSGIVDRRNRNTIWIRPLDEDGNEANSLRNPLMWRNDGDWAFIRVYRDPDQVIHYVKGNPYDPDGKTMERAKGLGLILETNPPDRFESVFALMRNETPDLDRSVGQVPQSFDEVAPFNEPRPGIPPILHRVREVLRDSGLEPDLVDHVGNGRVMILTQDSDLKKDIVRVLQKGGVEVKAGRRGDLIVTDGRRRRAQSGGTTTIPIETDDEMMRPTIVQREQRLKRERARERKAQGVTTNPQPVNPTQNLTPNPSITMVTDPATQVQTLQKYGTPEVLPGNKGIQMTFDSDEDMKKFKTDMVNNPMVQFAKTGHREKRQVARYFIQGFRRAMRQGDYGLAGEFLTRLTGMGIKEESIVKSRLVGRRGWQELGYYAIGIGDLGVSRLSRRASRLAPDL